MGCFASKDASEVMNAAPGKRGTKAPKLAVRFVHDDSLHHVGHEMCIIWLGMRNRLVVIGWARYAS